MAVSAHSESAAVRTIIDIPSRHPAQLDCCRGALVASPLLILAMSWFCCHVCTAGS